MKSANEPSQPTNEDRGLVHHNLPQDQQQAALRAGAFPFPDDVDVDEIPPEHKCEGPDWSTLFSHNVTRVLDINLVHTLEHEGTIYCVRFSADGKYLATASVKTAQIYDVKTGVKTCVLEYDLAGDPGAIYIRSLCFSPDGKYLATGGEDTQICVWDIAKKCIRYIFDGHQETICSLDFSLDGRFIVSGSADTTARIWDMIDGTCKILTTDGSCVTSVAIRPDGRHVATGSLDSVVCIWDVGSGALVERLRGHRGSVYSVAFTPDGKGLVTGGLDTTLKYWDVSGLGLDPLDAGHSSKGIETEGGSSSTRKDVKKGCQYLMDFTGHKDYILSVATSRDGKWLVSSSKDRRVLFWDALNGDVQCMLQGHKNAVLSIDVSPAGNYLATGSGDSQVRIWSYGNTNA